MKYTLLEHKFNLLESKFILAEAITQDDINSAIAKVDTKLKQVSGSKVASLQSAYDDYKVILGQTKTTGNSTSDFTAVKEALKSFWSTFKDTKVINNDDLDTPKAITSLLNKHSGLIKRVDNLISGDAALPTEDGNEINKKLWLKAAIDVENAFGDIIPEFQVALGSGVDDVITKKNLEFIKTSLVIFKNSLNGLKNKENLKLIETVVSKINNMGAIEDDKSIANTVAELEDINTTIKNKTRSKDREKLTAGEKLAGDASWDDLYKNTIDKNKFWEKYFTEFWGSNANKIKSLGSVFKQECEVYGFTDSNPFIKYIKGFLLKNNISFTSAQYQAIHNSIASGRGGKVKDLNDLGLKDGAKESINKGYNILAYTDLYTKPGKEIEMYMYYSQIVKSKASADADFSKILFHADNKTLKPLAEINSALNTLGWDEKALAMSDVDIIAGLIASDKTSDDIRELYVLMIWTYFLETADQDKYQATLDIDSLSKRHIAGTVKDAKKRFEQKYGKPTAIQARDILNKVITSLRSKK